MLDKTRTEKPATLERKTDIVIAPPNFQVAKVRLRGTAPYCTNKFSEKAKAAMVAKQLVGSQAKKGAKREPKDFESLYKGVFHIAEKGWYGVPAGAFRKALVSACRTVNFKMTIAKLSLFIVHEGLDVDTGEPLVRIHGEPKRRDMHVILANGAPDVLPRAFFDDWYIDLTLRWDADQFSANDVINLLMRVGVQVGIGAGRPDSTNSTGMGWGTFDVEVAK
jgi:hypothetical protein